MTVGRLPSILGPFYTDADWSQDFLFYIGDSSTEQSWSGVQGAISFVRRGLPKARFTLSSAAGSLVVLSNGLGIRLPAAEMAKRVPGTYDFELRRIEPDGDTIALLVGQVAISAGLSTASPPLSGGGSAGGPGGTVLVTINSGGAATTLASAGPTGASAKEAAIAAGALPTGATDAAFLDYLREPAVQASEALLAETEGARDIAVAAKDTAVAAAATSTGAADTATTKAAEADADAISAADARDLALGYRDDAIAARDLALEHREGAAAARDQAEDHRDAAQLYRDQSQAAAAAVVTDKYSRIGSKVDAEGFVFPASVKAIATSGYHTAGDGGHALYKRVATQPTHLGRLRSADRYLPTGTADAADGGWWEIVDLELNARAFGARGDGVTDDHAALQAMLDTALILGRPVDFGPGVFSISNTLRINTTGNAAQPVCGIIFRGRGEARIDGGWPQFTGGTRIDYNGAGGAIDAIIRVESAFTRQLTFQDFTLSGVAPSSAEVSGTTIYTLSVQNGIKFAETSFSMVHIDRIAFKYVQRCVGVYRVTAGNGEHVSMMNCLGSSVGQAFYCNNSQAYFHHFTDCSFVCYPNNAMFEAADPSSGGIGLQMKNVSGGFYPYDPTALATLVKYMGASTCQWEGGRIEHITKLVETSRGSASTAAPIKFDGIECTILANAIAGSSEIRFVELLGNENIGPIVVENCNFQVSGAPKRDLLIYAPTARGRILFRNNIFVNVRNVIPFSGTPYSVTIDFDKCFIDGRPAGPQDAPMQELTARHGLGRMREQHYGSDNAMIGGGRRRNLLLESGFGFGPQMAVQPALWTPPAPWTVTGNNGQVKDAFRWNNGFADQPWESAFGFSLIKNQKVEQALTNIEINGATLLRYRALVSVGFITALNGFAEPVRFALVDDNNPAEVYAERRFLPSANGTSPPHVVDLTRWFSGVSNTPRLVIENKHDGDVRIIIYWQLASDHVGPVAFVPTASAPVLGSKDWGAVLHNMAVLSRLQLPLKDDIYGAANAMTELQEGEVYLSRNDGRLVTYANGKWKRQPVFDAKTGAPSSGAYALGEITFNSNPTAAGKAAWICVSAGSPGIHKPWGAIDA